MGLKISTFKKGGQTFTDAYAKVSNVRYDNDSKIASFDIKVFVSKTDKNLISEIANQWAHITTGTDIIAQCYTKINTHISQLKTQILALVTANALILDNDNLKFQNENTISQLNESDLLQFDGAVEL